jgi:tight adherence protein B
MVGLLLAAMGAFGVYLVYSALTGPAAAPARSRSIADAIAGRLAAAGLPGVRPAELAGASAALAVVAGAGAFVLFGGIVPPLVAGAFGATVPAASQRARRQQRRAEAREAWPRMVEEIRLLTGSLGRSIPQALLEVGRRAPAEMRTAFTAAEREWLLTTDFARTITILKAGLADPTADAACETLLVAHEVGGTDLDRRLAALVEDRIQDVQGRKDAQAKQAGVRFARRFVLVVPLGMAVAGLSIGTGRAAYGTLAGQSLVALGLVVVAGCWWWAGRLLQLPEEERVFT